MKQKTNVECVNTIALKSELVKDFAIDTVGECSALILGLVMTQLKMRLPTEIKRHFELFVAMCIDSGLKYSKEHPEDVEVVYHHE